MHKKKLFTKNARYTLFFLTTFALSAFCSAQSIDADSTIETNTPAANQEEPTQNAKEVAKEGAKDTNGAVIKFAGVVQYIDGQSERVDARQMKVKIEHKFALYEGDRFAVADGSTLKFITRNDCVGVVYGPAQALTPELEKPWRIRAPALRWICPPGISETIVINNQVLDIGGIEGGEILYDSNRLLNLHGQVIATHSKQKLAPLTTHLLDGQIWRPLPSTIKEENKESLRLIQLEAWKFNQRRKSPSESNLVEKPADAPPKIRIAREQRWIIGPTGGGGSVNFDNSELNQKDRSIGGGRFQFQKKRNQGSWITLIEFSSMNDREEQGQNNYSGNFRPISTRSNLSSLQFGYRFNHESWWSQFIRLGGGLERTRININSNSGSNSYNSDIEYDFYMVRLSYGLDAFYSPSWLFFNQTSSANSTHSNSGSGNNSGFDGGFYAGIDFNIGQSLWRSDRNVKNENWNISTKKPPVAAEPWRLTTASIQMMFGLILLF